MFRIAIAAAMTAMLCSPVLAEPHTPAPGGCLSLDATKAIAERVAKEDGGVFLAYDGDAARKLIAAVNAIGDPTSFSADHIGVILVKSVGKGKILIASDPCGYSPIGIVMHIPDIMKALVFAFGERM